VVCVGWQAKPLFSQLGYNVPVEGVHGQMLALSAPGVTIKNNVYSWQALHWWGTHRRPDRITRENKPEEGFPRLTNHLYGLQIDNGVIKFGGDRVLGDLKSRVLPDGIEANYEHVTRLFPALKGRDIIGSWAG
jgi:glycine/D-amino acid oxidase-like deaminating enzyme